nr:putative trna-splicing endonuclease subunit tsp-1 [Quercus suber]
MHPNPTMVSTHPAPSALQRLIDTTPPPPGISPGDLAQHHHHLALQIGHNLHHQHRWTDLRIIHHGPDHRLLPRPVLSGLPPQRLYIHPDEQLELLQAQKAATGATGMPALAREREWVLPSQLREKWTLRHFGEAFAALDWEPSGCEGEVLFEQADDETTEQRGESGEGVADAATTGQNPWRMKMPKRLLLATLDDDSTVVYYIVHDGLVKPRQN